MTDQISLPREHYNAVRRVLKLLDGYMSGWDQAALHGHDGGMMTVEELRQHAQAAIKLLPPKARKP